MNIKQEIIDRTIYNGTFDMVRGLLAEKDFEATVNREDFKDAIFWCEGGDEFVIVYSTEAMILYKNYMPVGAMKGFDPGLVPDGLDSRFTGSETHSSLLGGVL